ncbi:M50 family metallopeptidase [Croceicoccus mobilis]|uniref:Peptidase M50 n=1 Tax=Croceicoccus mobilis TaxID=1703339 RepID=A0A917DZA4_9SPHN|nr:M50 family metallopeptidase [Croceicoccus mobilis]GGD81112.1 peptidase M50 [Croceicoccus mobilis]
MASRSANQDHKQRAIILAVISLVSVLAWQTQLGSLVLYPFTILATWFHEMGHGLVALLAGARFDHLVIFPNGSGYARILSDVDRYRIADAIISASGPLGPAIAGSLLIISSRAAETTRIALLLLGATLLLSTFIWVRSATGWLVLPALGLIVLTIAIRTPARVQQFAIQFLGVQACISVWRQFDYLFSSDGISSGQLSDTAAIAQVLFLPHWVWGTIISATTLALLFGSFRFAFRNDRIARSPLRI